MPEVSSADPLAGAVAARLRGEPAPLPDGAFAYARRHGVHLLLADRLPAGQRGELDGELRAAAVVDRWRARQARAVVDALAAAGVTSLVIKGAALAETHYRAPFLRPRGDLDILIASDTIDAADAALIHAGWSRMIEPPAVVRSAQVHYERSEGGLREQLDLHWRIANAQIFADAARFGDLLDRSMPLPALGPNARAPQAADALVIACVHRVAHHFDADHLIWLWDIHALASSLTSSERADFAARARAARVRSVCARGLERASAAFATPVAELLALVAAGASEDEPSAAFLDRVGRTVDVLASDLRHANGWAQRSRLLREHLFPSRAYMGARYPGWPAALLPLAYAYRIARGAPAWFRR